LTFSSKIKHFLVFQKPDYEPYGWTVMFLFAGLFFILSLITVISLCQAGVQRGERRMLERLTKILAEAKVIEAASDTQRRKRNTHREAAESLNGGMVRVPLEPVREEGEQQDRRGAATLPRLPKPSQPPPLPTRTYSLRFIQPRGSLASNMRRRMSAAFGGAPLIDLDVEVQAPRLGSPSQWLQPEEEGEWV